MNNPTDPTEDRRRAEISELHAAVESDEKGAERSRLQALHGPVWDTQELGQDFEVRSFLAPYVHVRRRSDGVRGTLLFQHSPRFYFSFEPERP